MKVIVDTCIWSLALRRKSKARISDQDQAMLDRLTEAVQDRRAAIIGPIRQEILSGIRDKAQFAKTQQVLEPFRDEEILAGDYVDAARLFNLCRDQGLEGGPVDMLICAIAVRLRFQVLTSDVCLKRCIHVLRNEWNTP